MNINSLQTKYKEIEAIMISYNFKETDKFGYFVFQNIKNGIKFTENLNYVEFEQRFTWKDEDLISFTFNRAIRDQIIFVWKCKSNIWYIDTFY